MLVWALAFLLIFVLSFKISHLAGAALPSSSFLSLVIRPFPVLSSQPSLNLNAILQSQCNLNFEFFSFWDAIPKQNLVMSWYYGNYESQHNIQSQSYWDFSIPDYSEDQSQDPNLQEVNKESVVCVEYEWWLWIRHTRMTALRDCKSRRAFRDFFWIQRSVYRNFFSAEVIFQQKIRLSARLRPRKPNIRDNAFPVNFHAVCGCKKNGRHTEAGGPQKKRGHRHFLKVTLKSAIWE